MKKIQLPAFGNQSGSYPFPLRVSPVKEVREMTRAEPYRDGALDSGGTAFHMYVRQYQFPHEYYTDELTAGHYTDRLATQDSKHYSAGYQKHVGRSKSKDLLRWFLEASDEQVMEFLKEVLRADSSVKWTGFRITGQANRCGGSPIFWLHLFAKNPESDTKGYTGPDAPNVKTV